jgi:hypothetical protein
MESEPSFIRHYRRYGRKTPPEEWKNPFSFFRRHFSYVPAAYLKTGWRILVTVMGSHKRHGQASDEKQLGI